MKARKKGSNEGWKNVTYVQLEGSDILFKEQYLEFQSDEIQSTEQDKVFSNDKHWQDVREKIAIAVSCGLLADSTFDASTEAMVKYAIEYADALIKELKKK